MDRGHGSQEMMEFATVEQCGSEEPHQPHIWAAGGYQCDGIETMDVVPASVAETQRANALHAAEHDVSCVECGHRGPDMMEGFCECCARAMSDFRDAHDYCDHCGTYDGHSIGCQKGVRA